VIIIAGVLPGWWVWRRKKSAHGRGFGVVTAEAKQV
jgi:hypothetical protein